MRLLLGPELAPETEHLARLERWMPSSKLPPCRLVWIGDLVEWGGMLHVAALVAPLVSDVEAFKAVRLELKLLGHASVARLFSELLEDGSSEPSGMYGQPGPEPHFPEDQGRIDLWFGPPDMVTVTAEEIPALAIATLRGRPRFASSPFCVVADRSAYRLVVVPAWEIFRFLLRSIGTDHVERVCLPGLGTLNAPRAPGGVRRASVSVGPKASAPGRGAWAGTRTWRTSRVCSQTARRDRS